MKDPWASFADAAAGSECCGYFERAPPSAGEHGLATWFDRGESLVAPRTPSGWAELRRAATRHLAGRRTHRALGYIGFDAVGLWEPALRDIPAGNPFPWAELVLADRATETAVVRVEREKPTEQDSSVGPPIRDTLPRVAYRRAVRRLQTAIRNGETFQTVLAHRRTWRRPDDLMVRAGRLRSTERFAFFFYLRTGGREILGASPESVVEVRGDRAEVNPIAGTRPRGAGAHRLPLARDRKELAEHRMLVDLARNDLGRVARAGSVRLLERERRVRYARLDHLVSRVGARLRPGLGPWDALTATFPAGTVSGAPKIRAIQLLRREERTWRGPYGGAVGLLRPGGRADWALAIRTGFASGNRLHTAAGAGIVYRSLPDREYDETLTKLRQLESTLLGQRR